MCEKCKNNSCSGGCGSSSAGKDIASLQNQMAELQSAFEAIEQRTKFLEGHPILCLEDETDIECFDLTSGLGSDKWEGWAVCNGQEQPVPNSTKKFTVANLLDKFIVGAGDTYDVGDTGGENTHTLISAEMPTHDHSITDPGHQHPVNDDGHIHGAASPAHIHSFTGEPHNHVAGNESSHTHDLASVFSVDYNGGTGPFRTGVGFEGSGVNYSGDKTLAGSAHTHSIANATATGTIGGTAAAVTVASANTGIEVENALTGISLSSAGESAPHENRPPYFAVLFVQKL